jgi:hypothetical protein
MMSEMILRVEAALAEVIAERGDKALASAFGLFLANHKDELGSAAIAAMREPTQEMMEAGFEASPHDVGGCRDQINSDEDWKREAVLEPYQAMIDAALSRFP